MSTWLRCCVGAAHHPHVEVALPGGGVGLDHLGDLLEVADHVGQAALGDLDGGEGQHGVAEGHQVEVGPEPRHHATGLQLVEPGLDRAPGHAESSGQFEHAGPRLRRPWRR